MPGHQFGEKKRGNRSVALRQVEAGADAAAFFAAKQNILLEHELADVLEADRHLVEFAAELGRELVNKLSDGEGFGNVAGQVTRSSEVPNEERENLVRIDEGPGSVNRADAIGI